jgi:hypothetical protein
MCKNGGSSLLKEETDNKHLLRVPPSKQKVQIIAIALEFPPADASPLRLLPIRYDTVRHRPSGHYSSKSMEIMEILGRYHVTMISVQQDLLSSAWLKVFGRRIESWHALGNAVRYFAQSGNQYTKIDLDLEQAQELNLHV